LYSPKKNEKYIYSRFLLHTAEKVYSKKNAIH